MSWGKGMWRLVRRTKLIDVSVNIQPQSSTICRRAGESPDPRLGIVKRRSWIEEAARAMCRDVYEATNAQPNEWYTIIDEASMRAPLVFAVARRWLVVDWSKGVRVRLTNAGRWEVRKSLS